MRMRSSSGIAAGAAAELHSPPRDMDVLARVRAGDYEIECGIATTDEECASVQAQRFRVYQRRGYHRAGLQVDRDAYDEAAAYFLAVLTTSRRDAFLLGSARVILGEDREGFRFPAEHAFGFELPEGVAKTAVSQRIEVTRVVAEPVQGVVVGGLLTPLGLIRAIAAFVKPRDVRCGLAVIKRRFLRVLQAAGVRLHEIQPACLVYPVDGPVSGYYHSHHDPVVPVYWLTTEITPSVERAIGAYGEDSRRSSTASSSSAGEH